ncbi:MAG: thermonuclease family protein [Alysiella sp.]|uniref:thermonuclease family protein n=1 Tax=Alysiella sp. TaxID=1872483 RepID=UPI0026DB1323|nr:thermonuclease family protein [Alysiella sp.]MDO4434475.1 thermonuclease family protein [Alysiella sp.]
MLKKMIVGIFAVLVFAVQADSGSLYDARVTAVHDGDTVRVTNQYGQKQRIRLAYIDAPELQQTYGKASRDALSALILHQKVQVEVIDTDRYRRQVARLTLNGQDINLSQLQNGNAWHYRSIARQKQSDSDYRLYEQAHNQARQQKRGLWQQFNPDAPWSYRYHTRQAEQGY